MRKEQFAGLILGMTFAAASLASPLSAGAQVVYAGFGPDVVAYSPAIAPIQTPYCTPLSYNQMVWQPGIGWVWCPVAPAAAYAPIPYAPTPAYAPAIAYAPPVTYAPYAPAVYPAYTGSLLGAAVGLGVLGLVASAVNAPLYGAAYPMAYPAAVYPAAYPAIAAYSYYPGYAMAAVDPAFSVAPPAAYPVVNNGVTRVTRTVVVRRNGALVHHRIVGPVRIAHAVRPFHIATRNAMRRARIASMQARLAAAHVRVAAAHARIAAAHARIAAAHARTANAFAPRWHPSVATVPRRAPALAPVPRTPVAPRMPAAPRMMTAPRVWGGVPHGMVAGHGGRPPR